MPDGNPKAQAVYTLRVDRDLLDRLREIADADHRTLAQKLRVMIEHEIADHEQQTP
jgi:predicted DNA-binding protein